MPVITLPAHFDGERICLDTPFSLKPDTKLMVTILPEQEGAQELGSAYHQINQKLPDSCRENQSEYLPLEYETRSIEAIFDGNVLLPKETLALEPNTPVRVTIEILKQAREKASSFLNTARSLALDGPSDWSKHIEDYLYNRDNRRGE
jgi:hypothetical protein